MHRFSDIIGRTGWCLGFVLVGSFASGARGQAGLNIAAIPAEELAELRSATEAGEAPGNSIPAIDSARRLVIPNLLVAAVLNQFDIDGDGRPDAAPDTDGDGLPDNWEIGGFEALTADGESLDRVVFFPAPSPIVPGTPPTPIFSRLGVATSALNPDTDNDGVSDFIEVFGLLFIDEDLNGLLDGEEWQDKNADGLPSPGEYPLADPGFLHDFDGFVFTDPTNEDTDGDGLRDAEDRDPLINPRAFGNETIAIFRFAEGDEDADNDGLGNGMDLGNDLVIGDPNVQRDFQELDNPENIVDLITLFRADLKAGGVMPESQIEDLLGADWDSNGLWRTNDVREWHVIIEDCGEDVNPDDCATLPPPDLFEVNGRRLYATQTFAQMTALWNDDPGYDRYGDRGTGLGWNRLLEPAGATDFLPDPRVWAVLYSWRMPGFDIDGDGFIGTPNISSTAADADDAENASVGLASEQLVNSISFDPGGQQGQAFDDRIRFDPTATDPTLTGDQPAQVVDDEPALNGRISAPAGFPTLPCGMGIIGLLLPCGLAMACFRMRRS